MNNSFEAIRTALISHPIYSEMKSISDVRLFMEGHVFAVWDFMSLVKALQRQLTNTSIPWTPVENAKTCRFINEIVFTEESDLNELGEPKSHFEMYLEAMTAIGANTTPILHFIKLIKEGKTVETALSNSRIDSAVAAFVKHTFDVISSGKPHLIAAAFTYGRENLIPDMFIKFIKNIGGENQPGSLLKFIYYLDRHIELDGDDHGPISMEMMKELCKNDPILETEAIEVGKLCIEARIHLWDSIHQKIKCNQMLFAN